MKFELKQIVLVSLILAFALGLRLAKHYLSNALSAETAVLSALTLPIFLIIYFAMYTITKDNTSALFALTLAATMPLGFNSYLWSVSAIFFVLTLSAAVIVRKSRKYWLALLILPAAASITHYSAILLAPIFIIYLFLLSLEHDVLKNEEVLFSAFACIISLIVVLSMNAFPEQQAAGISLLSLFALVGTRPIVFGVAGAYYGIKRNISQSLIFASSAGIIFLLLFFNILSAEIGKPYLFISLAALGGIFFQEIMRFIKISRLTKFYDLIRIGLFIFVLITGLIHWA